MGINTEKTVMIVDDSRIMRNIIKNTFELLRISANFLEARDGIEALQVLYNNEINLIILDWNMPNLLGIDFLKQVRSMEKYHTLPIIMVTSEASKLSVVEAIKAGVTAYITKPINDKNLLEKLSQIIF